MISLKTTKKMVCLIEEIEDCKKAIAILNEKHIDVPSLYVARNSEEEDGLSICLSDSISKDALTKQLSLLAAEFYALNKDANQETRSKPCPKKRPTRG